MFYEVPRIYNTNQRRFKFIESLIERKSIIKQFETKLSLVFETIIFCRNWHNKMKGF